MTSAPRAFLCSQDGSHNFPLSQRITTVGKENCDIIITGSSGVDTQHALIEYLEEENCYILKDLNSSNGTYLNDCRIQNATVRLVEQDTIRFGYNGIPFQFVVQSQFTTIPPINLNRQASSQQLQIIHQTVPSRGSRITCGQQQQSTWSSPMPNASLVTINNQTCCTTPQPKPPASLRSRPISAGPNSRLTNPKVNSWVKGYTNSNFVSLSSNGDNNQIDSETYRLEENELTSRVAQLEREIKIKTIEIRDLKEKVAFYQSQTNSNIQSNEIDQIKRDKSIAVGLVNTMQKDLANKDSTISKLAREIEGYKRDLKEKDNSIKELEDKLKLATDDKKHEEENQKKEKELIVLRTKFKTTENKIIDLTNQILTIKNELEESQRQSEKYAQTEKNLKEELEHSKTQYLDMQRAERTVRIDLEQIKRNYEKFRNFIIQSIYSTPGVSQPADTDATDEFISAEWKRIINERTSLVDTINNLKKKLQTTESVTTDIITNITNFELSLSQLEQKLIANGRRSAQIENELKSLKELNLNDKLSSLQKLIVEIYTNELNWQTEIEETLKSSFEIDINNNDSIRILMFSLQQKLEALNKDKLDLENKLMEMNDLTLKTIQEELEKKNAELSAKLVELEADLTTKHLLEIENIKKENEEFVGLIKNDFNSQISQLNEEKLAIVSKSEEYVIEIGNLKHQLEIAQAQDELHEIKNKLFNAETELKEKEESYLKQITEFSSKLSEAETSFNLELSIHKEQIKQHSLTIVNFEKEISRLREKEVEYLTKIDNLEKKFVDFGSKKPPSPKPASPVAPKIVTENTSIEITALNRTIELLRGEIQTYKVRLCEQDELVKVLRRDLAAASARLSDIHGEMTEKQKRELERNKQLVIEQQRELSDCRAQMAKLSEIIDKQTQQLDSLKTELNKSKSLVEKYRLTSEENGILAVELKGKLDDVECQLKKMDSSKREEGKITNELTAAGAQCKGERHEQVIQRQREALNELRQRVKLLEQTRPAASNQQQQMQQQIMLLKKQLAEVRASQALTEDIAKQANLARGNDQTFLMLEERTAHFETQTALDVSEESYLTLLRTISALLDITEIDGLRSMGNLPPDERQRLLLERAKSTEIICVKIKSILEKLERKDNLLKDYEFDLAKLRQAEFLLQKKSEQLDEIQDYSRSKEDEIDYLKESLKNAKSDLEKEKLLNLAIKQKKPFQPVGETRVRRESTDKLHHHCPPEDHRNNQVKKYMNEKIKRKDYELKTLKDELKTKSEELSSLTNRLTIVENSGQFN